MDTRHLIAYLLMAGLTVAIIALWVVIARKRKRHRELMSGRYRRKRTRL